MAKELGETTDPKELIPGNPAAVTTTATAMRDYGDALHTAGGGLKRIDTTDGWSGKAAEAFRHVYHGQPNKWLDGGDCFHEAAHALDTYNSTLSWAQGRAEEAIRQWNQGEAASKLARSAHTQAVRQAGHNFPFDDPGEAQRQAARDILNRARGQLNSAGDTAARTVGAARDKAPKKPGFWSKVGNFFDDVGADAENFAGTVVNGFASFGNAMLHHPGEVVASAAGVGLMALGATGEVGGGLLDITGIGTAPGLVLNAASAGVIVTGGGMAVAGVGGLIMHASSDDNVSPMRTDHAGAGGDVYKPDEGFRDSEFSKDEIVEFVNGHTGDGSPTMGRPTRAEVDAALTNGEPQKLPGQNAEKFEYKGVRVIVNYVMPWKSTAYYPGS